MLLWLLACAGGEAKQDDTTGGAVDCSARPLELPSPRGEVSGIWDPQGRMIFFGGDEGVPEQCQSQTSFSGQTWEWRADCGNFAEIAPEGPEARGRYAVAYDPAGRALLHGGRTREGTSGLYTLFDDTWALDLQTDTWSRISEGGPGARTNHVAAVANGQLLVYGGNDSTDGASFNPLGDTWAMDLESGAWEQLDTGRGPPARLFHAATVAPDGSALYVYGGGDEQAFFGPFFGDLWKLDLGSLEWIELHPGGRDAPAARIWATLHYDEAGERLLLFGGHDDGSLGNRNDLWAYDLAGGDWEELITGDVQTGDANGFCDFPADFTDVALDVPERRNAHAAAMTGDGQIHVFGGKTDCGIINDLWTLDVAANAWTERSKATFGESCVRAFAECESLCF